MFSPIPSSWFLIKLQKAEVFVIVKNGSHDFSIRRALTLTQEDYQEFTLRVENTIGYLAFGCFALYFLEYEFL